MEVTLHFKETDARSITYCLQRLYATKKGLPKLCQIAVLREAAIQAELDLKELETEK